MPPDLATLRRILDLERSRGYDDRAVIGGLGAFVARSIASLGQSIPDRLRLVELRDLGRAGASYPTWDRERRKQWVDTLYECIEKTGNPSPLNPPSSPTIKTAATPRKQRTQPPAARTAARPGNLEAPITVLQGIGPALAARFEKLGVSTVRDLLYYFPRRHIDYSQAHPIRDLVIGEDQTVIANVWQAGVTHFGRMKGTEAVVGDETGNIRVVWFNQPWLAARFAVNARVALSGKITLFRGERLFESPEWDIVEEGDLVHTGRLVPVYPLTKGLYPRQMRTLMKRTVDTYAWQEPEFLPADVCQRNGFPGLSDAIRQAHFPDSLQMKDRSRERLAFDELLVLQLGVLEKKRDWQEGQEARPLRTAGGAVERFMAGVPFKLTRAQRAALAAIMSDLQMARPMSRLLQGDVGSGKTVVATAALMAAVDTGLQGALMAPTQILAEQHFKTLAKLLPSGDTKEDGEVRLFSGILERPLRVALLTGNVGGRRKTRIYERVHSGEVDIVVGTHALIQKGLEFDRLALVVVDEQHRFGVTQRAALRQKGFNPHLLVMTATPIPRTLALTLFGDLDISTISEMPPGRLQVKTRWLWPQERGKAYEFVRRQVAEGHQAFIICPLVEESEVIEAKAAVTEFERLSHEIFPELRLGLLHGRMSGSDKEEVMCRFASKEFDILVSTAVVEVGIDIPNATVMLVEGADRFGLSQLHQFRGRVGRGEAQSYCILLADNPSPEGRERLALIEKTYDGFLLAEEDMKLRGPGEFFGTRQSGMPDLRMAKLSDVHILERAREEATRLFEKDPSLKTTALQNLRARVARAWKQETEVS